MGEYSSKLNLGINEIFHNNIKFSLKMAMNSAYILLHQKMPENFHSMYVYYIEKEFGKD